MGGLQINRIRSGCLPTKLARYLTSIDGSRVDVDEIDTEKPMIPVYLYYEREVYFIEDYILHDNKTFEKTAPEGLYRGGALLEVLTKEGRIVIYDERYKWLRMVGGIAKFNEGSNLTKTAIHEGVIEELSVLANGEKTRLVPIGMSEGVGLTIEGWGIITPEIEETGSLSIVKTIFNETNHAFELVVRWDISDRDGLVILHSEDWFRGGRSGFVSFVINDKSEVVGFYDGRHGFVPMPIQILHPTLKDVLQI